ncbi:MAG: LysR substrate-binding domain-containing protein [Pseudomonadota bacterium]|nr:LysR substrate-binding domain-containing protein [Pseudomonadota bacterium]
MTLRQLRSLVALADAELSVSHAAAELHLVQSAVSQHLSQLEKELETSLFVRHGKRLVALTAAGDQVLRYARQAMSIRDNILAIGRDHVEEATGVLRIGTTHTQARYVLPAVIRAFRRTYPRIFVQIHQGTPQQLVEMAAGDLVDLSICTEALREHAELTVLPCYRWNRSLIAPTGHPILRQPRISLETLCDYPLITYVFGFTGASRMRTTFVRAGLEPEVVLSAVDTDVIKTYVREGLGIGLIASMAYSNERDSDLVCRDLHHLFPWESTFVAYQRDKYLRRNQHHFIELLQGMVGDNGALVAPDG